jgi:hypothetical protein
MTKTMHQRTHPIQSSCFRWAVRNACTGCTAQEKAMDTQQLKLLAGLVRGLLQPSHPSLGLGNGSI